MVAEDAGECLLVFDRWRRSWELPGGVIDPGESSRDAASREFTEETGLPLRELHYAGVALFRLAPDDRLERAAVFRGTLDPSARDDLLSFTSNDEIEDVRWWTPGTALSDLADLDGELARRTVGGCFLVGQGASGDAALRGPLRSQSRLQRSVVQSRGPMHRSKRADRAHRRWLPSIARGLAIVGALLAVADLFRWGNRWYVSTRFGELDELYAMQLLGSAHTALVGAMLWALVAIAAAVVGWSLRVVRART